MFDNITFHPNPYLGYNTTFVSVSILCKFAMLPDVYILLSPQEEEVLSSSWGNRCTLIKKLTYINWCLTNQLTNV